MKDSTDEVVVLPASESPVPSSSSRDEEFPMEKKSLRRRIRAVVWDTLDRSPEERRFIAKIDFFILTWAGFTYFSKNLNTNNICKFAVFWVIVTFATSSVKNTHQLYACRFLVGLAEGTFYPAVHTVLGGWYTKEELAKRACIFFASAFVGSMFSGYLQAALYTGMDGVHGLSGWRWLFVFDGVITLPMALWAFYALPDLPSNTRVNWLTAKEKLLALDRMKRAGKQLEEPFTLQGAKRILKKWHFWVYTTYYTENIGSYMNLWLKSLDRYSVPEINTYPTVINAITIVTTLCYGWTSDLLQVRAPIVYFSLMVCFFAAMNLAVWDGVPFGLKWASFYLTG
ncbi:hypothetical protein Daus18300_004960 [Diaporthe australafricana]|uniref:Pantothenate transporter liz1 n=1 Tax=Diaporthe australafricana TaxID=127596 RepID=A0ABR3X4I7_9PEZI